MLTLDTTVLLSLLVLLAAGCADPDCSAGERRAGGVCLAVDAGAEPDAASASEAGVEDAAEPVEAGSDGDACVNCPPIPATPTLQGTPSAMPERVVWTWDQPEHTTFFEPELNGEPQPPSAERSLELALPEGQHTLRLRACSAPARCSTWVSSTTQVERFGADYGAGLVATRRAFARTPLGHPAAVACNDCALAADGAALALTPAVGKLSTAAAREADLLELNVAMVAGTLSLPPRATDGGPALSLAALLEAPAVGAASALLALEIVETQVGPSVFADALIDVLAAYPELMRNGRPLLVRADRGKLSYLRVLRTRFEERLPLMAPYLRVWLDERAPAAIGPWQDDLESTLTGVDGVLLEFYVDDLFGRLSVLERRGLGTGVLGVPGPGHGELLLAGLRDEVDLFLTDYRVDQARTLIRDGSPGLYVNARSVSPGSPLVVNSWADAQMVMRSERTLGGAAPSLTEWGPGFALQGGVLDFSLGQRAVTLRDSFTPHTRTLFSMVARLDDLRDLVPGGGDRALLGTTLDEVGGFSVVLRAGGNGTKFLWITRRNTNSYFAVLYEGAQGLMATCTSKNGAYSAPLPVEQSVWLLGVDDGEKFRLFINGRCTSLADSLVGATTTPPTGLQPLVLGALPAGDLSHPRHSFSNSYMQSVQVRAWSDRAGDEAN